jgi:hypothetical protein
MALDLLIFGVAFAAFCVWLTIRAINRPERWAKWTLAMAIMVPVLYVLSIGPAAWWIAEPDNTRPLAKGIPPRRLPQFYMPVGLISDKIPTVEYHLRWYVTLGTPYVVIPNGKGWKEAIR